MTATLPANARITSTRHCVRPDYRKQVKISRAEAALIAGVKVKTVEDWNYKERNHPGTGLRECAKKGPYRIDRLDLEKFLGR